MPSLQPKDSRAALHKFKFRSEHLLTDGRFCSTTYSFFKTHSCLAFYLWFGKAKDLQARRGFIDLPLTFAAFLNIFRTENPLLLVGFT